MKIILIITTRVYISMTCWCWAWSHGWGTGQVSTVKLLLFPFYSLLFGRKSLCTACTYWVGDSASPPWGQSILTLFWIILCGRFVYSQLIYFYCFGLKDQVPYVQEMLWQVLFRTYMLEFLRCFYGIWENRAEFLESQFYFFLYFFIWCIYLPFPFFSTTIYNSVQVLSKYSIFYVKYINYFRKVIPFKIAIIFLVCVVLWVLGW